MRVLTSWVEDDGTFLPGFLYRADGGSRAAGVPHCTRLDLELGEPVDPRPLFEEIWEGGPVDAFPGTEVGLPDGSGRICGGGGSWGSEGFAARLDRDGAVVWVLHLGESNEFVRAAVDWPSATFTNNLGRSLTLDLTSADFRA